MLTYNPASGPLRFVETLCGRSLRGAALLTLAAMPLAAPAASTNLQFRAEASLKETYDSNIFLQDAEPDPAHLAAARAAGLHPVDAQQSSWVTSVLPKIGLEYRMSPAFGVTAAYAPDVNFYHSASSEDHVAHRGTLSLGGKFQNTTWELLNLGTFIDGNSEGPTFARPGDIPALGGIPLRERREALVLRHSLRVTQTLGDWFFRAVASSYIHDFKTKQRFVPPGERGRYNYENYVDRQDVQGGMDFGHRVGEQTLAWLGYRYGQQEQFKGPFGPGGAVIDSPFDSAYHRVLIGVEGSPVPWLRLNLSAGPDIRQFSHNADRRFQGFDDDELLYFIDASVTWLPTKADTLTLKSTRFEMPAFSSFSVYEDIRNELLWRHLFNDQLTATAGFTLYIGDWQAPVNREDWIYTLGTSLSYAFTKKLQGEVAYSYDWVESLVSERVEPFTEGREFTRHLATVGVRYTF